MKKVVEVAADGALLSSIDRAVEEKIMTVRGPTSAPASLPPTGAHLPLPQAGPMEKGKLTRMRDAPKMVKYLAVPAEHADAAMEMMDELVREAKIRSPTTFKVKVCCRCRRRRPPASPLRVPALIRPLSPSLPPKAKFIAPDGSSSVIEKSAAGMQQCAFADECSVVSAETLKTVVREATKAASARALVLYRIKPEDRKAELEKIERLERDKQEVADKKKYAAKAKADKDAAHWAAAAAQWEKDNKHDEHGGASSLGKEEAAPEEQQKECDLAVEPLELGKRLDVSGCADVSPLPVGGSCAAACAGALVVAAGDGELECREGGLEFVRGQPLVCQTENFPASAVEALDLTSTDGDLKGFHGGFTDGTHGYLVPSDNGAAFGKVARFGLATFSTVKVLDLTSTDGDLKGFIGGFTDGTHGYLVPHNNGAKFGKVARFEL